MTVVEKAAYLKGLTEGLGIAPDSKEGKLWNALNELLSDMAHEIEDLHACYDEHDEALDEVCDELNYLEELTCDLDFPEDGDDYDDEDEDVSYCGCGRCYSDDEDEDDDGEPKAPSNAPTAAKSWSLTSATTIRTKIKNNSTSSHRQY